MDEAGRATLSAQGFGRRRGAVDEQQQAAEGGKNSKAVFASENRISARHLTSVLKRIGLIQIDSVNVLVRAHYFPLFSRLGCYPQQLIDAACYVPGKRKLFEYWGHEACMIPLELHPCLRWRMEAARNYVGTWQNVARAAKTRPDFVEEVFAIVKQYGPLGAGDVENHLKECHLNAPRVGGSAGWWGWSEFKLALEWLFWCGRITTASRRHFERLYDVTERVIPQEILSIPTPSIEEAHRKLLSVAGRALGVASEAELRDYFRLSTDAVGPRIPELTEAGELIPIDVAGSKFYIHREAKIPRQIDCQALISPFDPLLWDRKRTQRIFGFRYRIEIYTPAHKREHGYYVLPFLLGQRFVARVDLRADRKRKVLQVLAAYTEPDINRASTVEALQNELNQLAAWLGLEGIEYFRTGNLFTGSR
ncbi:MAG: YcaQ family DNA glycosylase [Verrucomicrobia bacterium]|nr:YcaQ family DNA glycosylase [Verrucomicrobiota bacterium]